MWHTGTTITTQTPHFYGQYLLKEGAMVLYKFYVRDQDGEEHLLGILPERRNDPKWITDESVVNLSKTILGPKAEILLDSIRFVQVGSFEDYVSGDNP
jgi:hypothetical protein